MSDGKTFSSSLDLFSKFFGVTSYLFQFHLKRLYFPKTNKKWGDYVEDALILVATWVIAIVLYFLFIYIFVYYPEMGLWAKIKSFLHPLTLLRGILPIICDSIFLNIVFLGVLYTALISSAKTSFLEDIFAHVKISGLIKSIKVGAFDESSVLKEEPESEVKVARKNIEEILSNPTVERITIITASGFDFFGTGLALPLKEGQKSGLKNGYLLDILRQREKMFQIVLLDPDCPDFTTRAEKYFGPISHKVLADIEEYKKNFQSTISNIKKAYEINKNIELRFTNLVPQWKMVFSEREVWVQTIIPGFRSDHTPMYGFKKSPHSLYHSYWNISEDIWHSAVVKDISKL